MTIPSHISRATRAAYLLHHQCQAMHWAVGQMANDAGKIPEAELYQRTQNAQVIAIALRDALEKAAGDLLPVLDDFAAFGPVNMPSLPPGVFASCHDAVFQLGVQVFGAVGGSVFLGKPVNIWLPPGAIEDNWAAVAAEAWPKLPDLDAGGAIQAILKTEASKLANSAGVKAEKAQAQQPEKAKGTSPKAARITATQTVHERMTLHFMQDPESVHWSAAKWAAYLHVSPSAVKQSPAWDKVMIVRKMQQADRAGKSGQ